MDLDVEDIKHVNQLEAHWGQARHLICNLDKYSEHVHVSHYNLLKQCVQAWREPHYSKALSLDCCFLKIVMERTLAHYVEFLQVSWKGHWHIM